MVKYDKLGRKIPVFDRSAANRKGYKTREAKNDNPDNRLSVIGGRASGPGFLALLKSEGRIEELRNIQSKGGKTPRKPAR